MHARTVVAVDRLRHEGRRLAVAVGDVVDAVLIDLHLVGHGQQRAEAVREYLIGAGVPAERLTAVGYGDEMPIADNKTKKGRAENRRVAFDITIEQISYETIYDHADSTLLRQHLEEIKAMQMPQEEQK